MVECSDGTTVGDTMGMIVAPADGDADDVEEGNEDGFNKGDKEE